MTWLGELNTALVIMALIYWCVIREFGTYFLMGWSGNRLFVPQRPYDERGGLIGAGLAVVVAIYAAVKPYPIDRDAAYIRTVELLCCQPDIRSCGERLDFRRARHLCFMLSADALCVIYLSLVNKAF